MQGSHFCSLSARPRSDRSSDCLARAPLLNSRGGKCGTALYSALAQSYNRIVELLLRKGANVNAPGVQCGITASGECHECIVEQLLGKGADVNARGGRCRSAALQAASAAGHDHIIEPLLGKEADVNSRGGDYRSALQAASTASHDKIVC